MPWLFIAVVVLVAVVSAIIQTMQQQQDKEPPRRRTAPRANTPMNANTGTGNSDLDRFLQEVEKLKKKAAQQPPPAEPPVVKPTRTAKATKKATAVPTVVPTKKAKLVHAEPTDIKPLEDAAPMPQAPASPITSTGPAVVTRAPRNTPKGTLGNALLALLNNKDTVAQAVMLNEIFGPPKCKRNAPQ